MCSISCHHPMTMDRTWSLIANVCNKLRQLSSTYDNGQSIVLRPQVWNMLYLLSSTYDNWQRIVINSLGMKHAPSVVIISRQWSGHGYYPPPVIWKAWSMHRQLSLFHGNGQSMVIPLRYEICSVSSHHFMTTVRPWWYLPGMKHVTSVVVISWQR